MIQGSIFVSDDKGTELVYTVVRGEPAHLLGYEVATGKMILDKPLEGADGVWDLAVATDGMLYIPGASGFLFSHKPGTQEVKNLGQALPGQTYVWNLTAGKAGELFGQSFEGKANGPVIISTWNHGLAANAAAWKAALSDRPRWLARCRRGQRRYRGPGWCGQKADPAWC